MTTLTARDIERYDRQMLLEGFGRDGQKRLKESRVLVVGVGGLGCPVSTYLTAAGIGNLTIIDQQQVELSNLNRQTLHWEQDIGRNKVASAVEKLQLLNHDIKIREKTVEIGEENVYELVKNVDIVVDALDNFQTRFLLNRVCVENQIPLIHGAINGLEGRLMTIISGEGPCLRCMIPFDPPEIKPFPVLGATPGVIASLQAMEVVKLLTGIGKPIIGRLLVFDGWSMTFDNVEIKKAPKCDVCGSKSGL